MAASGRYARGSVLSAIPTLVILNAEFAHSLGTVGGIVDFLHKSRARPSLTHHRIGEQRVPV